MASKLKHIWNLPSKTSKLFTKKWCITVVCITDGTPHFRKKLFVGVSFWQREIVSSTTLIPSRRRVTCSQQLSNQQPPAHWWPYYCPHPVPALMSFCCLLPPWSCPFHRLTIHPFLPIHQCLLVPQFISGSSARLGHKQVQSVAHT